MVYLTMLGECLSKSRCALHAYCLMTNHVHLLLTPPEPYACATLMRALGQRYVQYFNGRYDRSGTLWEGRFRSCLVDSPEYVLACYRYIELNPVRAGIVGSAAAYKWSSHDGNSEHTEDKLLTPHVEYLALAVDPQARRLAYQQLFAASDDPRFLAKVRDATNGGYPLLGTATKARLATIAKRPLERRKPGPPRTDEMDGDGVSAELPF